MSSKEGTSKSLQLMYRRWIYMAIGILASVILLVGKPVFNFQDDKGIIYVRSFSMTQKIFVVTQTELKTGVQHITATMPVKGLYYCNKAMLYGCILCLLCFFSDRGRILIALGTACIAGFYYFLMVHYAMKMSDLHYATLFPNLMSVWPAVVIQMMVLTWRNVLRSGAIVEDDYIE